MRQRERVNRPRILFFGAHNLISENGKLLAEAERFKNETVYADIDIQRLLAERRKMTTYPAQNGQGYYVSDFSLTVEETTLNRYFDPRPFVPGRKEDRDKRCDEILNIQTMGLKNGWSIPTAKMRLSVSPEDWIRRWRYS